MEGELYWDIFDHQAECQLKGVAETGLTQACVSLSRALTLHDMHCFSSLGLRGREQRVLRKEPAISPQAKQILVAPLLEGLSYWGHASADLSLDA